MPSTYFERRIALDEIAQRIHVRHKHMNAAEALLAESNAKTITLSQDELSTLPRVAGPHTQEDVDRLRLSLETGARLKKRKEALALALQAKAMIADLSSQYATYLADIGTEANNDPENRALALHLSERQILAKERDVLEARINSIINEITSTKVGPQ